MTKTTKTAKTAAKPTAKAPGRVWPAKYLDKLAKAKPAAKAPTLAKLTKNAAKATGPSIVPPLADALAAMGVPAEVAVGLAKAGKAGKVAPAALLPSDHGDEAIPAGKPSKVAKAGKAKVAATKPAPAAKPAKASETAGNGDAKAPTGAKGKIIAMIDASKAGVSAAEVCKALGWVRAGATIGRAIKLAPFKVAKVRDADGVLRYSREG